MLLGFKRQFVPYVLDGSKTHTIRGPRKIAPRVGEICHCYTGLRQKGAQLLGRWPCVKVERIVIYERGDRTFGVEVEGVELSPDEKNSLAFRDGFRAAGTGRAFFAMMDFWMRTHGNKRWVRIWEGQPLVDFDPHKNRDAFVFEGHIIHWKYSKVTDGPLT